MHMSCAMRCGRIVLIASALGACADPFRAGAIEPDTQRGASSAALHNPPRPEADEPERELPDLNASSTLSDYLAYAALNNAGLEAAFHRWKAALQRIPQVEALPDPRFTYGYFIQEVETRVGPQRHQFGLQQTFPWFGTLRDRADAASRDAEAAHQRYQAAKLDLFHRVTAAVAELRDNHQSTTIARRRVELLEQFERIALARYRVAAAEHPDLLRLQVELGKAEDQLRQRRDSRAALEARLNAALNRPHNAPLPPPPELRTPALDEPIDGLIAEAQERNPSLLALDEEAERERLAASLARKSGIPDLTFGVVYTIVDERSGLTIPGNGDDVVLATLSMNLPIWRAKYTAAQREALSNRLALASERQDRSARLGADLRHALYQHDDALRRIDLYRNTLIPKAEESLRASLRGFETGAADFLDLLDTERTLLEFQLSLERASADAAIALSRAETIVNRPLKTASTEEPTP